MANGGQNTRPEDSQRNARNRGEVSAAVLRRIVPTEDSRRNSMVTFVGMMVVNSGRGKIL